MLTAKDISRYQKNFNNRHIFYNENVAAAEALLVHFNGIYPENIMSKDRPGESPKIKQYRKDYYKSKTMRPVGKVFNSLQKIRKSQDWQIIYPKEENSSIAKGESLQDYMELNFFEYTSFTNWFFSVGLRYYGYDANSIILWLPANILDKPETEYYKPAPIIFTSEQIYDITKDGYVLKSKEKVKRVSRGNTVFWGAVYYVADTISIQRFEQTDNDFNFVEVWKFDHNLGIIPFVSMRGVEQDSTINLSSYRSRLSPMVPHLDEAAVESSDLKAEMLQHVNSKMWAFQNQRCMTCKGTGKIKRENEASINCLVCNGKGLIPFNPFEYFMVSQGAPGDPTVPTPPAGYLEKSIEPAKFLQESVGKNIHDALSSVGMEILDYVPMNESGKAKEWDRTEPNSFLHSVAEDVVSKFDDSYFIVALYRYKDVVKDITMLLPTIPVPEKFDILNENQLLQEINSLIAGKADPSIIKSSMVEYINKKYAYDEETKRALLLKVDLDPFVGQTEETLSQQLLQKGISQIDYTIHCNIGKFVDMLIASKGEDAVDKMTKEEKLIQMEAYATAELKKKSPSALQLAPEETEEE